VRKPAIYFFVLLLVAGLGYGLARLFIVRFAQGDVYPIYSTLRADGLGSKALYDSLAELTHAQRNYTPLAQFRPEPDDAAIFMLGLREWFEDENDSDDLDRLARNGNRLVLAFVPYESKPFEPWSAPTSTPAEKDKKDSGNKPGKKEKKDSDKESEQPKNIDLGKLWGMKVAYADKIPAKATTDIPGLEPALVWHTVLYFDKLGPEWRVLYKAGGKPVIVERVLGQGSIVLAADAYFSSNEALGNARLNRSPGDPDDDRATGLISTLVGNKRTVIFDETHLGVSENPGVSTLVRKYQLQNVVYALAVVAALFVWRNAIAFVPRREDAVRDDTVPGFDAAAAFVSLLRRNIPFDKLVQTCVAEWKRSFGHRTKAATVARVEALAAPGAKAPVETFRTITQILNEKR